MNNTVDLLQIKIERAKENLPVETLNAIATVDWRAVILGMREKKGYNFEQLGDLELETELLLCGLLNPADYPKELENRMKIGRAAANELVNEMNELVFKKIREELIKNTERKKVFKKRNEENEAPAPANLPVQAEIDTSILKSSGIEIEPSLVPARNTGSSVDVGEEKREDILEKIENPEGVHPMLQEKILGSVQMPIVKTEHSMENITKSSDIPAKPAQPPASPSSPHVEAGPGGPASPSPGGEESVKSSYKKDPYRLSPED